jgi:hypothetical protein
MRGDSQTRADKYLGRRRRVEEDKALRRSGGTVEDLRLWRRDASFREAERVARVACETRVRPRIINLADLVTDDDEGDRQAIRERMDRLGIRTDPYGNRLP